MKSIFVSIAAKQSIYAQSSLFKFMQDKSISPMQRLAFIPCSAPFILGFTDLCKYALRQEPANSRVQSILNQHTYEDGDHWRWFIEDMDSLGFNRQLQMNEALNFLWHEETKISRLVTYQLYQYIAESNAIEKLIILEAIESVADVFLSATKEVTDELSLLTNREYKYFGGLHVEAEQQHEAHADDVCEYIKNICLTERERIKSVILVEKIFELFEQWNQGLLTYAQKYQDIQPSVRELESQYILVTAS